MEPKINPYPISNSRLNAFKRSPKHLLHYLTKNQTETPAMKFGKAFHMQVLEPDKFQATYIVAPAADRRTKLGKEIFEQFVNDHQDRIIITADEMDQINEMQEAIMQDAMAADLINNLQIREDDRTWINESTMLPMRGIIDGVGTNYMLDLKTCPDADAYRFQSHAISMGYHRQAAIYLDSEQLKKDFYIIAIEKDAPYGVSVHELDLRLIQKGMDDVIQMMEEYRNWVEMGMPEVGYNWKNLTGIFKMDMPQWMQTT